MTRFIAALSLAAVATVATAVGQEPASPEPAVAEPAAQASAAEDAQPLRIVFQGGRTVSLEALKVEGDQFVVVSAEGDLTVGQKVPIAAADHMFGDKPAAVNEGIALLLLGNSEKAIATLEPVLESQKVTASVPGNFWLESARGAVLAYANMANGPKVDALLKELKETNKGKGTDTLGDLAKVLMLPSATKIEQKVAAFDALINDVSPTDVAAYATYFKGEALKKAKRDVEASESFLVAPTLYPTGNGVLNGAAELSASEFLIRKNRVDEAVSLLNSAARSAPNTSVATEAQKRLQSVK
jgi:tetratricopeptide (TPR) repeat protein